MSARKHRALSQPLYILEMLKPNNSNSRKFNIMGSTGNIYTVTISASPSCTCPNCQINGATCKHILFVLFKIMKYKGSDYTFTKSQLSTLFVNIPAIFTDDLLPSDKVINKYINLNNKHEKVERKELNDDVCPICMEDFTGEVGTSYCKYSCGKNIHTECLKIWSKNKEKTCIFCRQLWDGKKVSDGKGYINLS
ncbi:MAG: RING domain protein [Edafosvirus sp.]|uniref:RING domain protein n=1 Tax=Edafosvirus sp. TaxID=2487765 RepID=A0A3G4ZTA4_9VIRU|nr:MAG: RING domain protein [Edafosvirus sp.]